MQKTSKEAHGNGVSVRVFEDSSAMSTRVSPFRKTTSGAQGKKGKPLGGDAVSGAVRSSDVASTNGGTLDTTKTIPIERVDASANNASTNPLDRNGSSNKKQKVTIYIIYYYTILV